MLIGFPVLGCGGIWLGVVSLNRLEIAQIGLIVQTACSFWFMNILNKKTSWMYAIYFYFFLLVLSIRSIDHGELQEWTAVCVTLLFFLSENNQSYLKKSYEDSANEYQNQILEKQVSEIQNIYMTMRGWRHDYHNHLQSLKAYLKNEYIKEAYEYLDRLESDLDQVNQLIESGNIHLDAILNSKLSLALKSEIKVDYTAQVPHELTVSDIDLCVLIGNLIDNAVESCQKLTDGRRFLRLYIGTIQEQLYICVTNATDEVVRKMDAEYITTKRGNHGHGLKRINGIVEKYKGYDILTKKMNQGYL